MSNYNILRPHKSESVLIKKTIPATMQLYAFNNPFSHYKPEEEKRISALKIREDKTMEGRFKRFIFRASESWDEASLDEKYRQVLQLIQGLEYSSKDITNFLTAIAEFQKMEGFDLKAGLFLSALINNCNENTFTICTSHLNVALHCIGYENTKHIVINGNVGDDVGMDMKGGSITINGNAGNSVGDGMKRGLITINGNAGDYLGAVLIGGSITVKGNVGDNVGDMMMGGSITVKGNAGDNVGSEMAGGSITVKGNAGYCVGWKMEKGSITINGNALDGVGEEMEGGSITVKGNVRYGVGSHMEGGVIRIGGNFSSLAKDIKGGNIFHKGKQIVKNGRLINYKK